MSPKPVSRTSMSSGWRRIGLVFVAAASMWTLAKPTAAAEKTGFVRKQLTLTDGSKSDYVVFVPHSYNGTNEFPVILFLHGKGETKGGTGKPVDVGIGPHIKKNEKTFPFIVVIPQAAETNWRKESNRAIALGALEETLKGYKTDAKRVYLSGLSMGGGGTWAYAVAEPDRWAAIVPICGATNPETAEKIKDLPCWVFHGGMDPTVPVSNSRDMVAALKKAGGNPKYTEFPKDQHNSWDDAYGTAELWVWLGKQKRK